MKRVLIITYYWPPSGGSGVQRWLKMSKYLPEYGWQPVIYTPEDGEYPIEDPSLEKDVPPEAEIIRRPIVEPYTLYKKFLGIRKEEKVKAGFIKEKKEKTGWKERLSVWVRGNFFIPDARCLWVKPSVRFLKNYLKDHPVDAIVSTGPPHSMHLIALRLKEALGIPWIADFRDPWTEIEYYDDLHLTRRSDRKHHRLEHEVLTKADKVVTVTPNWAKRLETLGNRTVDVIYNGFDQEDVLSQVAENPKDNRTFSITYIGVLMEVRNPYQLWQAFGELIKENESFSHSLKINLIGQIDHSVAQCIADNGLTNYVSFTSYVPHDQVAAINKNSSVLMLTLNPGSKPLAKGLVPAKLFEYLASGRPILCIGPEDGDAARILSETQAGITVGFDDKERMKAAILDFYQRHCDNNLTDNGITSIEKYSRKALAREYVELLNGPDKPKVLFIASNIPTPKRKSNKVVMTIAHKLSTDFEVSVMHPAEWAPFPFNQMEKYKNIAGNGSWEDDGIIVNPFRYIRWFGKKNAFQMLPCYEKRLKRYIEQHGTPDLVHAHYALPDGYFAFLIHKIYHIPYIISFRKTDIAFLHLDKDCHTSRLMKEVLSNAKHIIVHNAAQQEALSHLGYESILMAHGIEESFVKPKATANNSNSLTITTIGELVAPKHIDWVINAVKDYKGGKNINLKIAGEGPMRKTWELQTVGHTNITFLGQISHDKVSELLQQSDIFALPSVNETFGLVYIEATAHQNAVIATKGTGIWGHFTDGEEMLHCDSYASFQTMLYKLIDDDGFRDKLALNAFEKTRNNYTWSAVIDKYASLYR